MLALLNGAVRPKAGASSTHSKRFAQFGWGLAAPRRGISSACEQTEIEQYRRRRIHRDSCRRHESPGGRAWQIVVASGFSCVHLWLCCGSNGTRRPVLPPVPVNRRRDDGIKSKGSGISGLQLAGGCGPPLGQQLGDNLEYSAIRDTRAERLLAVLPALSRIDAGFAGGGLEFEGAETSALKHVND